MKFKVGDRVLIIENSCDCNDCLGGIGKIGYVSNFVRDPRKGVPGKKIKVGGESVMDIRSEPNNKEEEEQGVYFGAVSESELREPSEAEVALFKLKQ